MKRFPFVVVLLCGGCGLGTPSAGVAVIESEVSSAADEIVIVAPPTTIQVTLSPPAIEPEPTPDDDEMIVAPPRPRPSTVAVVGDSLALSAADEIEVALATIGLEVLAIDAMESRRTTRGSANLPSGLDAVEAMLAEPLAPAPGLWIIALGTNDVASVGSLDGFRPEMRELLDLIPPEAPVIWVDLWIRDRADSIAQANRMIRAELRDWDGGSAVVDWFAHGDDDGVITGDGVHLTDAGQRLFAASIADTVDEMFAD